MRRGLQTNPDIDHMMQQGCKVSQQRCSCCTFDGVQIKLEAASFFKIPCIGDASNNTYSTSSQLMYSPGTLQNKSIKQLTPQENTHFFASLLCYSESAKMHTHYPL